MDDLSTYRLSAAEERLRSSKLLLDAGLYKDSIGRSYYAIFSAVKAVLALDQIDFKKHSEVIGYFQKNYVKSGIVEVKFSKYLQNAFQIRNNCDYNDFYLVSKKDAEEQYNNAVEMYEMIKSYLAERQNGLL